MKKILKLAVYSIVAMVALSSCSDSDDYPSQKDIETKIIGKWKEIVNDGMEVLTNDRLVKTFITKQEGTYSTSRYFEGNSQAISPAGLSLWCMNGWMNIKKN